MQNSTPQSQSEIQSQIDAAVQRMRAHQAQGRYQEALDICLELTRAYPQIPGGWSDAAINCTRLRRWQEAVDYGQTALARGAKDNTALHDALAHAHGALAQWDAAGCHGLQSLNLRDRRFGVQPVIPWPNPAPLPPPPGAQTRECNIIAFSLFGGDPKYCETAILNVQEQPQVYPHWVCRFYVDDSVPANVISRLRAGGAQVVPVEGAAAQWPGPMWRFLALDDPLAQRILFRDADSMISRREAGAVSQWAGSGKRFHMMRDIGSATELIMAGLWGAVRGSLPPLEQLMALFLSAPLQSQHFADQFFLRQYVWPYARMSLMQHDSIFGFMDAVPFPDGERPDDLHGVGDAEGAATLTMKCDLPDGAQVPWTLYRVLEKLDNGQLRGQVICSYTSVVRNGAVQPHIPTRYARWINEGKVIPRLLQSSPA